MKPEIFKFDPKVPVTNPNSPVTHGLTKREYFAAMAMQGYISDGFLSKESYESVVTHSVKIADALIEALNG